MHAALLTPELRAAAPGLARRIGVILVAVAALVARAFLRNPRRVGLIVPLCSRLNRACHRLGRLMAGIAAGAAPRAARPGQGSGRPVAVLPSARGWLIADLRHEAVAYAWQLRHLLAEPESAAIIAAVPRVMAILRPFCHMLSLFPPARPPRPARAAPAAAASPVPAPAEAPPGRSPPSAGAPPPPIAPPRPLHETAPCAHVGWPWFPGKAAGVA